MHQLFALLTEISLMQFWCKNKHLSSAKWSSPLITEMQLLSSHRHFSPVYSSKFSISDIPWGNILLFHIYILIWSNFRGYHKQIMDFAICSSKTKCILFSRNFHAMYVYTLFLILFLIEFWDEKILYLWSATLFF